MRGEKMGVMIYFKLVRPLCLRLPRHSFSNAHVEPGVLNSSPHLLHRHHGNVAVPDNYVIRNATSAEEVRRNHVQAAINEGWRPTIDEHEIYFSTDPTGFYVGELEGKVISCISSVKYGEDFSFAAYYIVDKPYRGKGYGLPLFEHILGPSFLGKENLGFDGVLENVPLYEKWGAKDTWVNRRMLFDIAHCATYLDSFTPPAGVLVLPAKQVDLDKLSAYDSVAFGAPHDLYLKALLKAPNTITLAATNSHGDITGLISGRRNISEEDGWKIGPLFADDGQVARALLKHFYKELAKEVSKRKVATMDIPADINPEAVSLAEELNATFLWDLSRMFTKGPVDIPKEKIFGFSSVELG